MSPIELVSFVWSFRFKQQAGEGWTVGDPYWHGRRARQCRFLYNENGARDVVFEKGLAGIRSIAWRFVRGSAGRVGPPGCFIRTRVDGRDVPTYVVSRDPHTWGFVLESCWAVYTSWETPRRGEPGADRVLGSGQVSVEAQWAEAIGYNRGFTVDEQGGLFSDVDDGQDEGSEDDDEGSEDDDEGSEGSDDGADTGSDLTDYDDTDAEDEGVEEEGREGARRGGWGGGDDTAALRPRGEIAEGANGGIGGGGADDDDAGWAPCQAGGGPADDAQAGAQGGCVGLAEGAAAGDRRGGGAHFPRYEAAGGLRLGYPGWAQADGDGGSGGPPPSCVTPPIDAAFAGQAWPTAAAAGGGGSTGGGSAGGVSVGVLARGGGGGSGGGGLRARLHSSEALGALGTEPHPGPFLVPEGASAPKKKATECPRGGGYGGGDSGAGKAADPDEQWLLQSLSFMDPAPPGAAASVHTTAAAAATADPGALTDAAGTSSGGLMALTRGPALPELETAVPPRPMPGVGGRAGASAAVETSGEGGIGIRGAVEMHVGDGVREGGASSVSPVGMRPGGAAGGGGGGSVMGHMEGRRFFAARFCGAKGTPGGSNNDQLGHKHHRTASMPI